MYVADPLNPNAVRKVRRLRRTKTAAAVLVLLTFLTATAWWFASPRYMPVLAILTNVLAVLAATTIIVAIELREDIIRYYVKKEQVFRVNKVLLRAHRDAGAKGPFDGDAALFEDHLNAHHYGLERWVVTPISVD